MTNDGYVAMQVIQAVNGWLFSGPVLILLFGIHVYFTIYTGVVQRKLGTGIRLSLRGNGKERNEFIWNSHNDIGGNAWNR